MVFRLTAILALILLMSHLLMPVTALGQDDATAETQDEAGADDQNADASSDGDAGEASDEAADDTAPVTFDSLYEEFKTLVADIRKEGGEPSVKNVELRDLHQRVKQFNEDSTPTELSAAVEFQLVEWTRQFGAVRDDAIARLQSVDLQHPALRIKLAEQLTQRQYKHEEAIEAIDGINVDLSAMPVAAIVRAEALVSLSSYDDAAATLDSIPDGANLRPEDIDRIYGVRKQIDNESENWSLERNLRDAEAAADDLPRVEISTDKGAFVIELFENEAPNTVANFISLIESGFYDGMTFNRVSPNLMVESGDPTTKKVGVALIEGDGPGYTIADEILEEGGRVHWSGAVSMVNSRGPDTAGSRFRVTARRVPHLDGTATIFGRVIDGMRVVRNIEPNDALLTAVVVRKRDHAYEPVIVTPEDEAAEEDTATETDAATENDAVNDDEAPITDPDDGSAAGDDDASTDDAEEDSETGDAAETTDDAGGAAETGEDGGGN